MNKSIGLLRRPAPARASRALRGRAGSVSAASTWPAANWQRLALPTLLLVTAAAYRWDLSASGYANSFYAAAVQAATKSWKAFFFGSIDSSNFITVDTPPASLWVMALSGRIFGFSSWSMLAPQALEGVAAVALLYAAIKRWFGTGAGLAAGALLAATPVAALMFRFNNPDALLVLLPHSGAGARRDAVGGGGRDDDRLCLPGQDDAGVPGAARIRTRLPRRGAHRPAPPRGPDARRRRGAARQRRLVGGDRRAVARKLAADDRRLSDNSILNLITGYNGLGRIFGSGGPGKGAGGGGGGGNFSGATGVLRLFNSAMGGQASWLLPAALLALGAGLIVTRGAPRTDRTRAALLLWGSWLAVSGVVFSPVQRDHPHLLHGRPHPRDRGAGGDRRADAVGPAGHRAARVTAGVAVAVSAGWAWALLDRTPSWEPWLRTAIVVGGAASLATLLVSAVWRALGPRLAVAAVVMGVVASVAASLELATGGEPVMAIGGFSGQGGELTLAQFQTYAKAGGIHYYIASDGAGAGAGGPGSGSSSSAITSWVKAHYKAVTIGGQTLYDLTQPLS